MKKIILFFLLGTLALLTIAAMVAKSSGDYALDVEKQPTASFTVWRDILITEKPKTPERPIYEVNGEVLDEDIQNRIYDSLDRRGIAFWYPYCMAQIYQESRFNLTVDNGEDYGLFQFRKRWWKEHAALVGLPGADLYNLDDQIEVYTGLIWIYLQGNQIADVYKSYFNSGNPELDGQYVRDVTQWYPYLRRLR